MKNLKVLFMGTPEFSVNVLNNLIENCDVVAVITQPDKVVGRKHKIEFSPIKKVAINNNIKLLQPVKIKDIYEDIKKIDFDIIITCAYGQIIPKEILDLPELGCINVHASLLPELRGGAPIHHAIIDGYKKTGITIMYMDEKMDTGDIIASEEIEITDDMNMGILHDKLSVMGASLLIKTLPKIMDNTNFRLKQDDEFATYAKIIKREDEHLDFHKKAREIFNRVRGLYPNPLSFIIVNKEEIKVLECTYEICKTKNISVIESISKDSINISCDDGIIKITKIKPAGKKEMLVRDYLNGIKKETLIGKEVQ